MLIITPKIRLAKQSYLVFKQITKNEKKKFIFSSRYNRLKDKYIRNFFFFFKNIVFTRKLTKKHIIFFVLRFFALLNYFSDRFRFSVFYKQNMFNQKKKSTPRTLEQCLFIFHYEKDSKIIFIRNYFKDFLKSSNNPIEYFGIISESFIFK